jgi:DNA-binding NtrC family response regulator
MIMHHRDPSLSAILLDLVMPDLDGMAVITRLRAAGYRIPIMVLVKPTALDSALTAIAAGAQDFSLIPASFERIAVSLKNMLSPSGMPLSGAMASEQPRAPIPLSGFDHEPRVVMASREPNRFHKIEPATASISLLDQTGRLRSLAAIERDVIAFALRWKPDSVSSLARLLGISRSTLYRRVDEINQADHTLNPPAYGDAA